MWRREYAGLHLFGHSQCLDLQSELRDAVIRLAGDGVDMFLWATMAASMPRCAAYSASWACVTVVLSICLALGRLLTTTMFPGWAVHPRYAIERRNRWMLERSDYVMTYVHHGWGGAAVRRAGREAGKRMIRL